MLPRLVTLLLPCLCLLGQLSCATFAVEFTGAVVAVADGDALTFVYNDHRRRVRLYGIDCPELQQNFGERAKQATVEWALGKSVTVKAWGVDPYTGHMIGIVILPDGRRLNHELVRAGLAWWDPQYPKETELAHLEAQARAAERGLWADPDPTPPWEFREVKGIRPSRRVPP